MRILKYPCGYDNNRKAWWAMMPKGKIIRTEWVDDGTYKGYWVWAVVDDEDPIELRTFQWQNKPEPHVFDEEIQLGVLESQEILVRDYPFYEGVFVVDGKIYLRYDIVGDYPTRLHIVGYKTGQNINVDLKKYEYVGFAPLKIKDEIAIYFFMKGLNNEKR